MPGPRRDVHIADRQRHGPEKKLLELGQELPASYIDHLAPTATEEYARIIGNDQMLQILVRGFSDNPSIDAVFAVRSFGRLHAETSDQRQQRLVLQLIQGIFEVHEDVPDG